MLYMNFLQKVKRQASPLSYLKGGNFFKKTIMLRQETFITFLNKNETLLMQ